MFLAGKEGLTSALRDVGFSVTPVDAYGPLGYNPKFDLELDATVDAFIELLRNESPCYCHFVLTLLGVQSA